MASRHPAHSERTTSRPRVRERHNVVREHGVVVTESDWVASQHRTRRLGWLLALGGLLVGVIVCLLAMMIADQYAPGPGRWPVAASLMLLLLLPLAVASQLTTHRQTIVFGRDAALTRRTAAGRQQSRAP